MLISILRRGSEEVLYSGDHETIKDAVEAAHKAGVNLRFSNLYGTDLSGSNLSGSNLSGSNLYGTDLSGTNLSGSNLSGSNLSGTDLSGSNLSGSNLSGSNLYGSNLYGAKINWNSHALISRLLLDAAGQNVGRRKIAGLILVSPDWCWETWLSMRKSRHFSWAIDTLAPFVREGDGAPKILVERATALKAASASSPTPSTQEAV